MHSFMINKTQFCKILVVGDIMLDRYWFGETKRYSPEAPVPIVNFEASEDRLGGAANVARNIVALGARATLIGIIGSDEAGLIVQNLVNAAKIKSALVIDPIFSTIVKIRILGKKKQLLRVDFESSVQLSAKEKVKAIFSQMMKYHDIVIFSDYAKGALDQIQSLISISKKEQIPVLIDPKGNDYERYFGAQLLTPNSSEISQIVGDWNDESELTRMAQQLRKKLSIEALIITRSSKGMTLFTEFERTHTDVKSQEVFDVSGAGDTVLATLAVCKGLGLSWKESMYWANQAGAIAVRKLGTSVVNLEELLGAKV